MVDLRSTLKEMDEHLIQARYDPDVLWEVATATQDEGSYAYFRVAIELSLAFALGDVNSLSFGDQLELDSHCTKLVGYSKHHAQAVVEEVLGPEKLQELKKKSLRKDF